ncbi:MAG: translation initiation factor [Acidobacteriota bacterium]
MAKKGLVFELGPGGAKDHRAKDRGGGSRAIGERPVDKHDLRVRREKSGRRGKVVTVAAPLFLAEPAAKELLAELRKALGTGGSLKAVAAGRQPAHRQLELQGDRVPEVVAALEARGFRVRAG